MYGFGGGSGFNPWVWIILILIVLQWFRVGDGGAGGLLPESGLVRNGGLFIITIFLLVACGGCFRGPVFPPLLLQLDIVNTRRMLPPLR